MIDIRIVLWDELSDKDKGILEDVVKNRKHCYETLFHPAEGEDGLLITIWEPEGFHEDLIMLKERGYYITTLVVYHTVKEPEQVKKKIQTILNNKAFW